MVIGASTFRIELSELLEDVDRLVELSLHHQDAFEVEQGFAVGRRSAVDQAKRALGIAQASQSSLNLGEESRGAQVWRLRVYARHERSDFAR